MPTLYWDFFGPRAEGLAAHYCKHLNQFLASNGFSAYSAEAAAEGVGHWAVTCKASSDAAQAIARALRPQRIDPE
jgi:uncharacterized protein (DUF2249 family)